MPHLLHRMTNQEVVEVFVTLDSQKVTKSVTIVFDPLHHLSMWLITVLQSLPNLGRPCSDSNPRYSRARKIPKEDRH